ncbi:hypothetical protein [Amycolatopsis sp. WAC 04197]|uniref:hypothetical protein n=1 Tax=Amycolatopsis sp. WAC 04197 TaxID=2203199 RepID=UPI001F40EA08|nr:hypothetical protein [Amycolatopsis sp. WAC 04197]
MTSHVFVDESKERGYLVTAAALLSGDLTSARRAIRGLVLPGQRRLHFTHENDGRRKRILDTIAGLGPTVTIYDASAHHRRRQREACLDALVEDLSSAGTRMLVLESDESIVELDRKTLYRSVRRHGCHDTLEYRHLRAFEEPLLAVPDALAGAGNAAATGKPGCGKWRKRSEPYEVRIRETRPTHRPEGCRVHFAGLLTSAGRSLPHPSPNAHLRGSAHRVGVSPDTVRPTD